MSVNTTREQLTAAAGKLESSIPLVWRRPGNAPTNPVAARIDRRWPLWSPADSLKLRKNQDNWFYCEFTFPSRRFGLPLTGDEAMIFIHGWGPFTLWLDGREMYHDDHIWKASGPIGDPIVVGIEPGRTYRLVANFRPTEVPGSCNPCLFSVVPRRCLAQSIELGAAAVELALAERLARDDAERGLVKRAAAVIDPGEIAKYRWSQVSRQIAKMEAMLMPLSPQAKAHTVHLIGHTHIDMDWQWTWADTEQCIRRDYQAAAKVMQRHPDVTFSMSQIPTYDTIRQQVPELFEQVKTLLAEGRWENLASTWVEGDLSMADGESLARHFLYAQDWSKTHLGRRSRVFFGPDTFGHPGNMPQLARLGGCDLYFHWRCNPGGEGAGSWPAREWQGIDGTRILALSSAYGGGLTPGTDMYRALHETVAYIEHGFTHSHHFWGLGDHGGGINEHNLWCLEQYRGRPLIPTFVHDTLGGFADILRRDPSVELPTNQGETYLIFKGCYTTHAKIKKYNRECETALLTAEAVTALADLDRNRILRDAWTPILYNQFHDIFDGASVRDAYEEAYARAAATLATARRVQQEALDRLLPEDNQGRNLAVVNPLGFPRTEIIELNLPEAIRWLAVAGGPPSPVQHSGGKAFAWVRDIPAFGKVNFPISPQPLETSPPPEVIVTENGPYFTIQNRFYTAKVTRNSGIIASYLEHASGRELVACGTPRPLSHIHATRLDLALNVFQIIDESPNPMSAWHIHDLRREENLVSGAQVERVETGPVFARLRVTHRFRRSRIVEDILFYQDSPRIDFEATVDWHERGGPESGVPLLKVGFAVPLRQPRLRCEGPFTVGERLPDGMEEATQKWVALTGEEGGFAVYNDGRYGYDALGGRLRLSLLRNSYTPDPESDNGIHRVRFAFEPHAAEMDNAELVRRGMAFNRPLLARRTKDAANGKWPKIIIGGASGVVCSALRRAEHSDALLLRLFECNGQPAEVTVTSSKSLKAAACVNFLEISMPDTVALSGHSAMTNLRPYEVKTLRLVGQGTREILG